MVREARYAWNDEENDLSIPDRQDPFDDLDDPLLDVFPPSVIRQPGKEEDVDTTNPERRSERRDLSGADWVNEGPSTEK